MHMSFAIFVIKNQPDMIKIAATILATAIATSANGADKIGMIVGTYTANGSKGIYTYSFDRQNGKATLLSSLEAINPSFVALSPDGTTIYTVDESNKETDSAAAIAYSSKSGDMKPINSQQTEGGAPCYISTNGKIVVTANYNGGSISVFPVKADGSLAPLSQQFRFELTGPAPDTIRQRSAHVHCTVFSPDGTSLFATDLGNDRIYRFAIENDTLRQTGTYDLPAGSGPRHLTFSPDGKFAYLITELSGKVMAFKLDGNHLVHIQTATCDKAGGRGSADIHISPDGRFLYASNRLKDDGIAIFSINQSTGMVTQTGYQPTGIHPRNFAITPDGRYLLCACRDSNVIKVYRISSADGSLADTGNDISLPSPVCIIFKQ